MKNAFSLLETLVVIVVIAIIASVALIKTDGNMNKAHQVGLKNDVALIQNAITRFYSKAILKSQATLYPIVLDNANINQSDEILFSNLIDFPMLSTSNSDKTVGKWIKQNQNSYAFVISSSQSLVFVYDNATGKFECDFNDSLCKGLY